MKKRNAYIQDHHNTMRDLIEISKAAKSLGLSYGSFVSGAPSIISNRTIYHDPAYIRSELPEHEIAVGHNEYSGVARFEKYWEVKHGKNEIRA